MKLSKFVNLVERKGEKAHREAEAMGLKYKGFGYWVDPNTGKVTHKTEGDNLVPVEPDVETDMWKGGPGDEGGAMGPGGQMDKGGMSPMGNQPQLGMPMGSGQNIGTAEPGLAKVQKRLSWEPGPDGDTAVDGSEPPGDIPADAFVGKPNYYQWVAGPKGTNFKNLSYDNMKNAVEGQGVMEGVVTDIEQSMLRNVGAKPKTKQQSLPLTKAGKDDPNELTGAREMMGRMMTKRETGGRTTRDANKALKKLEAHPAIFAQQVNSMLGIANRGKDYSGQDTFDNEVGKKNQMWRKGLKLPAIAKDADKVAEMNKTASPFFSDPNYDLDQFDEDEAFGEGAFGQVWMHPDRDSVIKRGKIGVDELKALHAMKDNPNFPTLINGRFDTPFMNRSSEYNNPVGADDEHAGPGGEYWDPDDQSDWDKQFITADGTYAMSRARGRELSDAWWDLSDSAKETAVRKFWHARKALHMAGFSHNDMHGGNVFVGDDGEINILDLGLAKDDPLSALMEGLGGADAEQGGDYQLARDLSGAQMDGSVREKFLKNIEDVRQSFMDQMKADPSDYDDYDEDSEYSPQFSYLEQMIEDGMRGDIRMKRERLEEMREAFPFLQDRKNVMGLIKQLYNGVGESELQNRMAIAFDKRKAEAAPIRMANQIRALRGASPIDVKNPNVVDPRHLDYDD